MVSSLQLVVSTYACGAGNAKVHHGDASDGNKGYAHQETTSGKLREYVEESTEPAWGLGSDATWNVGAPDGSEYDEFYEWQEGKWQTTEKSLYMSGPTRKTPPSWKGASSLLNNDEVKRKEML